MADEELSVKVAVEGFEDFQRAFKDMESSLADSKEKLGELGNASKQTGGDLDTGGQGAEKMKLSLTDLKSGIDMALGAVRTFGKAVQAVFNFAQEGAQVLQLRETVKSLGIDLDALRAASGGTVDDMTLISSAAKLLAGTTGELNVAMADAAPRLLEIARAAVKLDPTIGSVAFVYESLAKGIKKNQPLLIDNANIVVKVSTAQEKLAQSLGKSVAALTDEEKAVALLEATLEGGANMIDQMGGNIESATDSYARFTAEVKNLTDGLKANVAEGLTPTVHVLANSISALNDANAQAELGAKIFGDDYTIALQAARRGVTSAQEAIVEMNNALNDEADTVEYTVSTYQDYIEASFEAIAATNEGTESFVDYDLQMRLASKAALDIAAASRETAQAIMATTDATNTFKAALGGAISNEMAGFRDREGELVAKGEELRAKISELEQKQYLTTKQKEELAELRSQLEENKGAVEENALKHEEATRRILFGFAEQRLAMGGLTSEELMMLQGLAKEWGLVDQATYDAMVAIDNYADSVDDGTGSLDEMGEGVKRLSDKLLGIPTEINVNVRVNTTGELPPGMGEVGGESAATREYYQHGGTSSGRSMLVGEGGPEILTGVRGGARVLSAPTTARMMAQNSIVNNYNLTTNAMTRPGGLSLEFAAMQMGSR